MIVSTLLRHLTFTGCVISDFPSADGRAGQGSLQGAILELIQAVPPTVVNLVGPFVFNARAVADDTGAATGGDRPALGLRCDVGGTMHGFALPNSERVGPIRANAVSSDAVTPPLAPGAKTHAALMAKRLVVPDSADVTTLRRPSRYRFNLRQDIHSFRPQLSHTDAG